MASDYGYITVANLEAYMIVTFDSIDARYTDAVVEAHISQAERVVRSLTNTTSSTDGIKALTLELSKYLMSTTMYEDHPEAYKEPQRVVLDGILEKIVLEESYSPAGTVPMSGIDR